VRAVRPAGSAGFTFIEMAVVLSILGILLAVGVPNMSNWMLARKAVDAAGFYQDGMALARSQALSHNSASRMVLIDNANGQMDWRVDLCFPTPSEPCSSASGAWSSASAAAGADPDQAKGFRSVLRSAAGLSPENVLVTSIEPVGAEAVYFTPLGWVDGREAPRVQRIRLAPSHARRDAFVPMAVALTLGGRATICNPDAADHTPRKCPPP
jgi:type IV fimbrial biogenesis protein FimT